MVDTALADGLASGRSGTEALVEPVSAWVRVRCGTQAYGIALERVREILTPQPFTRLPGCDAEVAGLVGVRGRVVTVFDLGRILGSGASASLPDHRLVLADHGDRVIGLVVDDVTAVVDGVLRLPAPDGVPAATGVVSSAEGGFVGLDVDALVGRFLF